MQSGMRPKKIEGKGVEVGLPACSAISPVSSRRAGTARRRSYAIRQIFKSIRLIKRRTVANEACDAGRVLVNEKPAKASAKVKPWGCN